MVIIAGVIGAVMWRAYHNERQRTDMTRDAIAQNTNAMVQLCFEIKSSNELSKMTTEKLLEALLKR